jgi:hypothetical protein
MGHLAHPHHGERARLVGGFVDELVGDAPLRGVAPQVAFERQTLKPVFSLDRL